MKRLLPAILFAFMSQLAFAQSLCDSVFIDMVQLDPINPGYLIIKASNQSQSEFFSYPGFRVYDAEGELLGEETVNLFGFVEQAHFIVPVDFPLPEPGAEVELSLELWTGFYTDLQCSWTDSFEIRPDEECGELFFSLAHTDQEALADPFLYQIYDDQGELILQDEMLLAGGFDFQQHTLCLPLGCYEMVITTSDAVISSDALYGLHPAVFFPVGEGITGTALEGTAQVLFEFEVWAGCTSIEVGELSKTEITVFPNPSSDFVRVVGGQANATVRLVNSLGREVRRASITSPLYVGDLKSGIYVIQYSDHSGVAALKIKVE